MKDLICLLTKDLLLQYIRIIALWMRLKPRYLIEIRGKRLTVDKLCFWLELAIISPGQIPKIGSSQWDATHDQTKLIAKVIDNSQKGM